MDYFWWGMLTTAGVVGVGVLVVWLTRDDARGRPEWPYHDDEGGM